MVKKEIEEEIDQDNYIIDDEEDEIKEEELEQDLNSDEFDINTDNNSLDESEMPSTPMGLAHQITKESDTVKNFKELPREVKLSFLDNNDKVEVKHHARAYRTWRYIEKIIDLRIAEDNQIKDTKTIMTEIKSKEDFMEYLKNNKRGYLINDLEDLKKEDIDKLLKHITKLKTNTFLETIEDKKDSIKDLYEDYREQNETPQYIDDMDNIGKVMDTTVVSMGYKGNAATHSVMTINAVKNENIEKDLREKTKFSLLDSIKNKFG